MEGALTSTLDELDIACAGGWSLWRPSSINFPYYDMVRDQGFKNWKWVKIKKKIGLFSFWSKFFKKFFINQVHGKIRVKNGVFGRDGL